MENTNLPTNLPADVSTIIQSLDDLQAQDMVCLDIKQSSSVAEYLVICTSKSHRHGKSLAQNVIDNHPKGSEKPKIEGDDFAEWILLDCGHTIVHIMLAPVRSYYNLEKLWDNPTNHS